jgi:ATP-dependent Zn protease
MRIKTTFGPTPSGVAEGEGSNSIELGKLSEASNGKNNFFKGGSFGTNIIYIQRQSNYSISWDKVSEKDKKKLKKKEGQYQVLTKNEGPSSETKKKFIVNPPKPKETAVEEKSSLSFAGLFKWFIIIIIILAIIIFVGSQIMQISNSWEK